jgi:hypothetical protein
MSKTLSAIQALSYVAHVDDERAIGNSIIVTLQKGFAFKDEPDCGVRGFDTVSEAKNGTAMSRIVAVAALDLNTLQTSAASC